MTIVIRITRAIAYGSVVLLPLTLRAQNLPPIGVPRPPDPACQNALAAASQVSGNVSSDSLATLLINVSPCHPELGRAVGFLIRAVSTSGTDDQLSIAFSFGHPMVDSAIFGAVREVASSGASSENARVLSLMTMFHYLDRGVRPAGEGFVTQVRGAVACAAGGNSDDAASSIAGDYTPLPFNAASESRAVAVAIQQNASASPALQSASYCVLEAWRKVNALPSNAHWAFTTASLSVTYVCGNRFRIQNQHPLPIALQWQVASLPRKTVLIAPNTAQGPGERLLDAGLNGPLSVFLDGDVIFTTPNSGSSC